MNGKNDETMYVHWSEVLERLGACSDAIDWARTQPSYEEAWESCERADRLMWLAETQAVYNSMEHRELVLASCMCARRVLSPVPKGEHSSSDAIEMGEAWARGEVEAKVVSAAATKADECAAASAHRASVSPSSENDDGVLSVAMALAEMYVAAEDAACSAASTVNSSSAAPFAAHTAARAMALYRCANVAAFNFLDGGEGWKREDAQPFFDEAYYEELGAMAPAVRAIVKRPDLPELS